MALPIADRGARASVHTELAAVDLRCHLAQTDDIAMTPADLIQFPDTRPGIHRRRAGRGFSYLAPDGTRIDCPVERKRLKGLGVPPAYNKVWMCPDPRGHLQATGRDVKDRKQYLYHPDWTAFRAQQKFADLPRFGAALPRLRRRILADLARDDDSQPFAIAAVLALLDRMSMRIGNVDYAIQNKSYGATTLTSRHLKQAGDGSWVLRYTAKGGRKVRRKVQDRTLERVLNRFDDLPGTRLISWRSDAGKIRAVTSDAVNAALVDITGEEGLTAKTFRTWNGTVAALEVALRADSPTIKAMAEAASQRLANTPTIARKSYIHPRVIALTDTAPEDRRALVDTSPDVIGLRQGERALLHLLET